MECLNRRSRGQRGRFASLPGDLRGKLVIQGTALSPPAGDASVWGVDFHLPHLDDRHDRTPFDPYNFCPSRVSRDADPRFDGDASRDVRRNAAVPVRVDQRLADPLWPLIETQSATAPPIHVMWVGGVFVEPKRVVSISLILEH